MSRNERGFKAGGTTGKPSNSYAGKSSNRYAGKSSNWSKDKSSTSNRYPDKSSNWSTDKSTSKYAGKSSNRSTEKSSGSYAGKPAGRPAHAKDASNVNIRQLVLKILADFDDRPGDPEKIADKILSRKRIEHRDRRFVFELVYGILRNRMYLDYVINSFIPEGRALDNALIRRIMLLGAYQIIFLDRVPNHAAVNEAVNLVKHDRALIGAAGFVNAVLRNIIKSKHNIALPDSKADLCGRLSIEFSHPAWMIERWIARYGLSNTRKILTFNNQRPATYLRRRARDVSRQQFEADVRTLCEPGCGFLSLYYKMRKNLAPESLRLLQNGQCSVQAPSCGWAVAMMDMREGQRVADLCCAPGGKTTLMAELVGGGGTVVACDSSRWRMGMVTETVNAQGLGNVRRLICDSARPPFAGTFDGVLLDAPCSGTGVMHRHPEARFVRTIDDISNSQVTQRELLNSAANMVGEGGVVVYSTCSLEPEENEDQVKWFLDKHPDFRLDNPPDTIPAMFVDSGKCLRVTPFEHGMDGIFAARFKRESGAGK